MMKGLVEESRRLVEKEEAELVKHLRSKRPWVFSIKTNKIPVSSIRKIAGYKTSMKDGWRPFFLNPLLTEQGEYTVNKLNGEVTEILTKRLPVTFNPVKEWIINEEFFPVYRQRQIANPGYEWWEIMGGDFVEYVDANAENIAKDMRLVKIGTDLLPFTVKEMKEIVEKKRDQEKIIKRSKMYMLSRNFRDIMINKQSQLEGIPKRES